MPRQPRQASQPPREVLRRPERPPPHPPPPGRPLPSLRPRPTCRPGPDDAVARGGDFARTLAFDVLLAPVVEIAQTTAFRLAFTIAFAYVIPVIPVAARGWGAARRTGPWRRPRLRRARSSRPG